MLTQVGNVYIPFQFTQVSNINCSRIRQGWHVHDNLVCTPTRAPTISIALLSDHGAIRKIALNYIWLILIPHATAVVSIADQRRRYALRDTLNRLQNLQFTPVLAHLTGPVSYARI